MEVKFVEGLRVSDARDGRGREDGPARQGQLRHRQRLNRHGQPAVGLSRRGRRRCSRSRPHANAEEVGFVGEIERVDVDVLNHIAADYIPVIASAGADREGNSYNVNADAAAGKVAAALRAHKAIFLTDVEGWLADPADPATLISQRDRRRGRRARWRASRAACARSSRACVEAIRGGVESAHIVDGRRPHSLLLELFTDAGIGTMVTP